MNEFAVRVEEVTVKNDFSITKDGRTFLNGTELKGVLGLRLLIEAGKDPEVEIRVAISSIDVDGYTDWLGKGDD